MREWRRCEGGRAAAALMTLAIFWLFLLYAAAAAAQRADENAVTAAEDAFGVTIGRESLGLYTSSSVRGFSPTVAGNVRIDGMYFDQVWGLNSRLRSTSRIRVGPSAQGYPFPAPTGIVDYSLRIPGVDRSASALVNADAWGSIGAEADFVFPVSADRLSVGLGLAAREDKYYNGTSGNYANAGGVLRYTPTDALEILPFGAVSEGWDDEVGPVYVPAGNFLPPRVERRDFEGPGWADNEGTAYNYGVLARYAPTANWILRAGLFESAFVDDDFYAHLLLDLQPDGSAQRLIVADPPSKIASTSGELRATRSFDETNRLQLVHINLRARGRRRNYDGSDFVDLGPRVPGRPVVTPRPEYEFGPQTHDRVDQLTAGFAYELHWDQRALIGAGLQRSEYEKQVDFPDGQTRTEDRPWLYNVAAAWALNPTVTFYASYTRGLEESGVAPDAARNRNEALPAIRTRQADAGARIALGPAFKLLAGVFDVAKPYFTLDEQDVFRALGEVTHRGVELSLTGSIGGQLDVVAGAVLMDPEVSGPEVESGAVGTRPVGQPERTFQVNLDWKPPRLRGFSFDLEVTHTSDMAATRDNVVELPARTLVDIGARYRFRISRAPATLRLAVANATDESGYDLRGSGAYDVIAGRQISAYVTVDW
jgi:iron complex outermembrane recepter protein